MARRLADRRDPSDSFPASLRVRGTWPPPPGPRAAIVGSRRPSPYGEAGAERPAGDPAAAGVGVVGGPALGAAPPPPQEPPPAGGRPVPGLGPGVGLAFPRLNARPAAP